jgi:SAM-dependent methyltransferase
VIAARAKPACSLCGEPGRLALFRKDGYGIVRCAECGLVYVDLDVDSGAMEARYGADYYGGGVFDDYLGQREERIASARRHCDVIAPLARPGRLLDVGCAAGFFLQAASERWDVTGVELSSFAAEYARREFGHVVLTGDIADADLPDDSFDVVTLWNTVEHMSDPRQALAHVGRVAAPGALVVLTTGNVRGPLARRDLSNWNLMTPPEHLYFFDPSTITRLLAEAGLSVRRIVQDGLVSSGGLLARPRARVFASALGLGNVMTVYARRSAGAEHAQGGRERVAARLRPVSSV